jgi:DNA-binding NarL/FixJ family response regulator
MAIKVLGAVQSEALARVIRHVLRGHAGISGIQFADSEQELTEQAQRLRPRLIIVSSRLLGRDASATLAQLKRTSPQSKLILICNFEEFSMTAGTGIVDVCVLDETLVQQLPAIVRRLTSGLRAKSSTVQKFGLSLFLFLFSAGSAFA